MRKNVYIKGFLYLNILFCLLLLVNLIPRSVIERNLVKAVEYYEGKSDRYYVVEGLPQTNHDVVTDCIVFNIISNVGAKDVLKSTIDSKYYISSDNYSDDLRSAILDGKEPNISYSRYWHGYTLVYRFLLLFMSVRGIKVFMVGVSVLLFIWFSYLCVKNKLVELSIALLGSFVVCMTNYSFNTLGHVFPLVIALLGCILVVSGKCKDHVCLFLLLGITVAFFDFLSIETLTLTMPLMCLIVKNRKNKTKMGVKEFVGFNIHWLIGYSFAFLYKWILCVIVLGKEYLKLAISEGVTEFKYAASPTSGISLNIDMLFPFVKSSNKALLVYFCGLVLVSLICFLFHKKRCNEYGTISFLVMVFLIPYVRFFVLNNHVVYHYFFTYRAQIVSVCSLFLIVGYTLDFAMIGRLFKGK